MRKIDTILCIAILLLLPALAPAQTWTGAAMTTDWDTPANWSPMAVPNSPAAVVIIPTLPFQPALSSDVSVGTILMSMGASLNLNGNKLHIYTVGGFTGVAVSNGTLVDFTPASGLSFTNSTLNSLTVEKHGASSLFSFGGNTFNGTTIFDVKATAGGFFRMGMLAGDSFTGNAEFRNQSAVVNMSIAELGLNTFLGNVTLVNTSSGAITFGTSTSINLLLGAFLGGGITDGDIFLRNLAQTGPAANNLGTPETIVVSASSFVGNFSCSAQTSIALNGSVFNGNNAFAAPNIIQVTGCVIGGPSSTASTIQKTNAGMPANNFWFGNNKFGPCSIINFSDANLRISASVRDTFRADAVFENKGAGLVEIAFRDSCYFGGNVTLDNSSPAGIRFGSTIAGGRATIQGRLLSNVYSAGPLELLRTDQLDSSDNDSFSPTAFLAKVSNFQGGFSCAAILSILIDSSTFHRTNIFSAPNISDVQSSVFSDVPGHETSFTKLAGGADNFWLGNNSFGEVEIINDSPNNLTLSYGFGAPDRFIAEASFIQSDPAGNLFPCSNSDCLFDGDISTVGTSKAIAFGPSSIGRAVISGNAAQVLRGDLFIPPVFYRILMNTTGTLQLQVPITINGQVVFTNGIILSDAVNVPTFAVLAATGMSDNSHVAGPARRIHSTTTSSFTFPVGKNNKYAPVTISKSGAGIFGTFQVEYFNSPFTSLVTDATLDHVSGCEYWDISRLSGGGTVNVTMTWDDVRSCGITDLAALRLARWNGANWTSLGGTVMGLLPSGSITASNVGSFSPFTLASTTAANPLPVELLYFNARPNGKVVDLNWATASEKDNDYFTVERSRDGVRFDPVLQVPGAGTSTEPLQYFDTDARPLPGVSYYRLRQTDFDGAFSFSSVVAVQMPFDDKEFAVYPNPAQDHFYLDAGTDLSGLRCRLLNNIGQTMPTAPQTEAGRLRFSTQGLAAGMYFLEVIHGDAVQSFKVMIR
ncbi:MAG: T9SS type A sorting domain-containing protein [Saprospiraceae bacterium]|nr:T9SS type A sorting domain-containing protein [Saprospiraceae bacterium]